MHNRRLFCSTLFASTTVDWSIMGFIFTRQRLTGAYFKLACSRNLSLESNFPEIWSYFSETSSLWTRWPESAFAETYSRSALVPLGSLILSLEFNYLVVSLLNIETSFCSLWWDYSHGRHRGKVYFGLSYSALHWRLRTCSQQKVQFCLCLMRAWNNINGLFIIQ